MDENHFYAAHEKSKAHLLSPDLGWIFFYFYAWERATNQLTVSGRRWLLHETLQGKKKLAVRSRCFRNHTNEHTLFIILTF